MLLLKASAHDNAASGCPEGPAVYLFWQSTGSGRCAQLAPVPVERSCAGLSVAPPLGWAGSCHNPLCPCCLQSEALDLRLSCMSNALQAGCG